MGWLAQAQARKTLVKCSSVSQPAAPCDDPMFTEWLEHVCKYMLDQGLLTGHADDVVTLTRQLRKTGSDEKRPLVIRALLAGKKLEVIKKMVSEGLVASDALTSLKEIWAFSQKYHDVGGFTAFLQRGGRKNRRQHTDIQPSKARKT